MHLYIPAEHKYLKLYTTGSDEMRSPVGLTFDDELRLYVSDSGGARSRYPRRRRGLRVFAEKKRVMPH